jgi:hypothetical protein
MVCVTCGSSIDNVGAGCLACGGALALAPAPSPAPAPRASEASERMREAGGAALTALKAIAANPVGELEAAHAALGPQRALGAGAVFASAFAVSLLLVFLLTLYPLHWTPPFVGMMASLLVGLVPFCSIVACCAAARRIHHRGGSTGGDAFVAGAALLPLTAVALAGAILGGSAPAITAILAILAFCYATAILIVGLLRLSMVPEALLAPLLACSVLVSLLLSKLVLSFFGSVNPLTRFLQ